MFKLFILTVVTVRTPGSATVVTTNTDFVDFESELAANQAAFLVNKQTKEQVKQGILTTATKMYAATAAGMQVTALAEATQ